MTFRDSEKLRYRLIKTDLFSAAACRPGLYKGIRRPFCLEESHSSENLFAPFRAEALSYFEDRGISWHDGLPDAKGRKRSVPSNHLCCSQTACVNALWPLARDPGLLARVFCFFLPSIDNPLPLDADGSMSDGAPPFLAFEWIGTQNYLGEVGNRARGANATSADFAFRFRRKDGRVQLVLGEWKYTEYYGKTPKSPGEINKTRWRVYHDAYDRWTKSEAKVPPYETFFVEPYYQLMRLTLLAREMERMQAQGHGEMDADWVSVLYVAPEANRDLSMNLHAAPVLARYGHTLWEAFGQFAPVGRFLWVPSEHLLTRIGEVAVGSERPWARYLLKRYGWWRRDVASGVQA